MKLIMMVQNAPSFLIERGIMYSNKKSNTEKINNFLKILIKNGIKSFILFVLVAFVYYMLFKEITLIGLVFIVCSWLLIIYNSIYTVSIINSKIYKNKNTLEFMNKIVYNTKFYQSELNIIDESILSLKPGKYKEKFLIEYDLSKNLDKEERFNKYKKLNKNIYYKMFFDFFYLIIYNGRGDNGEQVEATHEISTLFANNHFNGKKLYEKKYNFKKQGWIQQLMFIVILVFFSWAMKDMWIQLINNPIGKGMNFLLLISFLTLDTLGSRNFKKASKGWY